MQDSFFAKIGNAGTAAAMVMLVAAFEEAKPRRPNTYLPAMEMAQTPLSCVLQKTYPGLKVRLKDRFARSVSIDYGKYLLWRDLIPVEASSLPERTEPSGNAVERTENRKSSLWGKVQEMRNPLRSIPNGQRARSVLPARKR